MTGSRRPGTGFEISIWILVLFMAGCGRDAGGRGEASPDGRDAGTAAGEAGTPAAEVGPRASDAGPTVEADGSEGSLRPDGPGDWPPAADSIPGTAWTRLDWEIFAATLREAETRALDTLPVGEAVAAMGRILLGTPYIPRTLEVPGPERLVINLRALDCVTFVENVLALTRLYRTRGTAILDDPPAARGVYESLLVSLRYRDARVDGYASRLHYFSDWLGHARDSGWLTLVTAELGGTSDDEPVDFMSSHPDAYPQLADARELERIRRVEARLNDGPARMVLPQDRIADAATGIRTGDIIAATSTVPGLDVAHTGIAVRTADGTLRLLHAPLVGSTVVLSERSLAERIAGISSQDGIMVARPRADAFGGGAS